jgi:hypothetical protein
MHRYEKRFPEVALIRKVDQRTTEDLKDAILDLLKPLVAYTHTLT